MGRALPVFSSLDDVRIASPCSMAWNDMVGGDKVRFCGACQKNVFNLSGMTREEGLDLLQATEGRVCVRFWRRADGTVLTEDCPVGLQKALKRAKRATLAACATAVGACAALLAVLSFGSLRKTCEGLRQVQTTLEPVPLEARPVLMGEVAPVEMKGDAAPPVEKMGKIAVPPPREMLGGAG